MSLIPHLSLTNKCLIHQFEPIQNELRLFELLLFVGLLTKIPYKDSSAKLNDFIKIQSILI